MPEQAAAPSTSETWTQESVEKQATEIEQQQAPAQEAQTTETVETVETPEPEKKEKDKLDNLVGAVTELRAQRREALARAQAVESQNQALQRQMVELLQRVGQPAQQQVDPNDPFAVMQSVGQQTAAEVRALREERAQEQQATQQATQYQNFVHAVKAQEAEFVRTQPDATEGINFLKQNRVSEYKAAGLSHNEAVQRMLKDEHDLVVWAMQAGENPAKAAFDMAVARGYVSPKQKLAMQRDGQGASLPTGAGGKVGGEPSLEALLKLSGADFAKATSGDKWEKLLKKYS